MVKWTDLKKFVEEKIDLVHSSRLQCMVVGKSRQELNAASHTHGQEKRGCAMDPCWLAPTVGWLS